MRLMSVRCKEAGEKRWEFSHTDSSHAILLAFDFNAEESGPPVGVLKTRDRPCCPHAPACFPSSSTRLLPRDTIFVFFDKTVHDISAPHQSDGRRFHGRRSYSITNVARVHLGPNIGLGAATEGPKIGPLDYSVDPRPGFFSDGMLLHWASIKTRMGNAGVLLEHGGDAKAPGRLTVTTFNDVVWM
jgi:hypothetical protein